MIGKRICIICTPRSGSQLCAKLINQYNNALDLNEYFERWNQSIYQINDEGLALKEHISVSSHFSIEENYHDRIEVLKSAKNDQPLTLRLFLLEKYPKNIISTILSELQKLDFEFIQLDRKNVFDQILSYLITIQYRVSLNKNVFGMNSKITDRVTIDLSLAEKFINILYPSIVNLSANVKTILPNTVVKHVYYETIFDDIGMLCETKFNNTGIKSIEGDPLDLVINKDDLLSLLKTYKIYQSNIN